MRRLGKIVMLVALAVTVSSATQLSKVDQEFMKSEKSGKLNKLDSQIGELIAIGDEDGKLYGLADKTGKEMEKYADAGSGLAVCRLAHFYGPQSSESSFQENYDLALKWLTVVEIRELKCENHKYFYRKWGADVLKVSDAKVDKMTSLEYMIAAVTAFESPKEIKKHYKHYYLAKEWLTVKKTLLKMPKAVK